jgi:sugar phosphate permease
LLTSIMATGMQGGYYAITIWLPTYLKTERGLSVLGTGGYLGVIITGSLAGYLAAAYLVDYIGRRNTYMIFFALGIVLYASVPTLGHLGSAAVRRGLLLR